jgi:hypothetical protein
MSGQTVSPPLFRIAQNGRYGYIDNTGKVVVQPQFVWGSDFKDDLADVYVCGRMVSMDEKGNLLPHVQAKLEARKIGDKFGFVDASGQFRIPAQYDEARWFSEGLAAVRVGSKWGYIDEAGQTAIDFQYGSAGAFEHGRAGVIFGEYRRVNEIAEISANADRHGIIDKTGRIIVKGLDSIGGIFEGRMAAEKNDRWAYLDADGVAVTRFIYEDASRFVDGLAAVRKNGKWGYIDENGKVVIPFKFEEVDKFSEGLAVIKKDGKSGYIDKNGRIVIPLEFDEADTFQTGLAAGIRGKESGFIDKSGRFAFKLAFDFTSAFRDSRDLSQFWTKDERFGYVDHSGRVLWESAAPENMAPFQFPSWFQEKREESCVGITDDVKHKVTQIPPERSM